MPSEVPGLYRPPDQNSRDSLPRFFPRRPGKVLRQTLPVRDAPVFRYGGTAIRRKNGDGRDPSAHENRDFWIPEGRYLQF